MDEAKQCEHLPDVSPEPAIPRELFDPPVAKDRMTIELRVFAPGQNRNEDRPLIWQMADSLEPISELMIRESFKALYDETMAQLRNAGYFWLRLDDEPK